MARPTPDSTLPFPLLAPSTTAEPPRDCRAQKTVLAMFAECRAPLLRYARYLGVDEHDAEEVVQEVFLALFQHLRMGRSEDNLRGWVFRVAHNLGLKRRNLTRCRGHAIDGTILQRRIDPGPNPEQGLNERQRQQALTSVFNALPERDRCCLLLRSEGLRYRAIADTLGISLGSVAQSLARSLEKLHRADRRL